MITAFGYDALNRITQKSYNDGTAGVSYSYDASGVANGKGHLTQVANANSVTHYTGFDGLGRVTGSNQQTGGQTYGFGYAYNLAGALTAETYPTGRVVTNTYDGANRAAQVSGTLNGQTANYVVGASYNSHGAPYNYLYGNSLGPVFSYNSRLQLAATWAGFNNDPNRFVYYFGLNRGTTTNNGNLNSVQSYEGGPGPFGTLTMFNDYYAYDGVNRVTAGNGRDANNNLLWAESYGHDQYGNHWVSSTAGLPVYGNTPTSQSAFDAGTNRIAGGSYDAAGNQLGVNGDTLTYDAENRQVVAVEPPSSGGGAESYLYDGTGQRVQKVGPGGVTFYVYDALGQLAAEYSTGLAAPPCATCYLSYDHLGSVRLVTDENASVVSRHDYVPFGQEIPGGWAGRGSQWGVAENVNQKFTGQERDSETGLDFFQARYFEAALGRFTSPDPMNVGADLANPQSWNLYSYGLNNPLRYTDPDGHDAQDPCGDNPNCVTVTAPYPGLSPLDELLYRSFFNNLNTALQIGQQTQQIAQQAFNWLSAPRDPGCMNAHTMGGAGTGMAGGALAGAAFGPADVLTVPMGALSGYVGGAGLGRLGGLISCMSGPGSNRVTGAGDSASRLSSGARKKLGSLAGRAGEQVRDVIRSRGGTGANVKQVGRWADKSLGETAQAAVDGDPTAETAVKIAKQAGRLGQQY